jgi:MerR family transcriptional regulator, repressor of the yfmOP operon
MTMMPDGRGENGDRAAHRRVGPANRDHARTIRYYEEIGLLPVDDGRPAGSTRVYDEETVQRVNELVRLRDLLGLSLEELRDLVAAEDRRAQLRQAFHQTDDPVQRRDLLAAALPLIDRQLALVRRRREDIVALESDLAARRRRIVSRQRNPSAP